MSTNNKRLSIKIFLALIIAVNICSCKKFVETKAPVTSLNALNVYDNDATAASVLTGIYTKISQDNAAMGGLTGITLNSGLSSDELTLINGAISQSLIAFYRNALSNAQDGGTWSVIYPIISSCNAAIEGCTTSAGLTPVVKQQLIGEAKFIRAFCYFYLVNLYGDVPLAITTDYKINALLSRTPKEQVYQQIVKDLLDAQAMLSDKYLQSDGFTPYATTGEQRVRPTKWSATALLARVYLYMGNGHYADAETQATTVINNAAGFSLLPLDNVFLKNSKEAIWQIQPVASGIQSNTGEGFLFVLPATGPNTANNPVYLSNYVYNSFETGDLRKTHWVNSVKPAPGIITYYYPYKYKIGAGTAAGNEYSTILRLGEQYLIRAEARAQLGKITGAASAETDINAIRTRAGLPATTATTLTQMMSSIMHERQVELFTEWGHRWLDLKRTATVDAVMGAGGVCVAKGGTWDSRWQWYPLPVRDIQFDLNLVQNSGY